MPSAGAASGASTSSLPPAPVSTCWSSGGGKSGSVASASGVGSAGVDPSGADSSGAGATATGPAPEDPSWVKDPGAGVVEAGVSWRSAALAALMKSKLVNTQVERSKCLLCNQRQTYSVDFFLMALFTRKACRGISVVGGGVSPANGAVPATAMVTAAVADGATSSSSGSTREEEVEGLQEDIVSTTHHQHIAIQQGNNKYPEDSISCAFRFHSIRRPCGTSGKASANSTTGSEELSRRASPSASSSAWGLTSSVDPLRR
jgi:hypothetical protein